MTTFTNPSHTIAILGGSGFVGHHLCQALAKTQHRVRILTRDPFGAPELAVFPNVKIKGVDANQQDALTEALQGCDVIINLVGILNERGHNGKGFYQAHVKLVKNILHAMKALKIKRLLHMSALGADSKQGTSFYLKSKGEAEDLLSAHSQSDFQITRICPSIIFGPGDSFFNRFAGLLKIAPVFCLPCPDSLYAPVYVGDVVNVFIQCIDNPTTFGKRYELTGPTIYSLYDLVCFTAQCLKLKRFIIPLPNALSYMAACIMEYIPGKPFSKDNYLSTQHDSVSEHPFPEEFAIEPTAIETVVPSYICPEGSIDKLSQLRKDNAFYL